MKYLMLKFNETKGRRIKTYSCKLKRKKSMNFGRLAYFLHKTRQLTSDHIFD
jgi:hypothetical protein